MPPWSLLSRCLLDGEAYEGNPRIGRPPPGVLMLTTPVPMVLLICRVRERPRRVAFLSSVEGIYGKEDCHQAEGLCQLTCRQMGAEKSEPPQMGHRQQDPEARLCP